MLNHLPKVTLTAKEGVGIWTLVFQPQSCVVFFFSPHGNQSDLKTKARLAHSLNALVTSSHSTSTGPAPPDSACLSGHLPCIWLSLPTGLPVPQNRSVPDSGPLDLSFPLPGMLFPQCSEDPSWLHLGLGSRAPLSGRPFPSALSKRDPFRGFPGGSGIKNLPAKTRNTGLILV